MTQLAADCEIKFDIKGIRTELKKKNVWPTDWKCNAKETTVKCIKERGTRNTNRTIS